MMLVIIQFFKRNHNMNSVKQTTLAVALGAVVMSAGIATEAQANPFGFEQLTQGYQLDGGEGKCGEGKCGADMKKSAEKAKEGKCGEGKCGEGKCGVDMKKATEQGKEAKANMEKSQEGQCGGKR